MAPSPGQHLQPQEQQQEEQHPQQGASLTTAQPGRSTTDNRLHTMDRQDRPLASQPLPSQDRLVQGEKNTSWFIVRSYSASGFHTMDLLSVNRLCSRRSENSRQKDARENQEEGMKTSLNLRPESSLLRFFFLVRGNKSLPHHQTPPGYLKKNVTWTNILVLAAEGREKTDNPFMTDTQLLNASTYIYKCCYEHGSLEAVTSLQRGWVANTFYYMFYLLMSWLRSPI